MLKITREEDIPPLPQATHNALLHALQAEQALPPPDRGEVFLLEPSDTDTTFLDLFGTPLANLSFERVIQHPDRLCYHTRNNSRCDTLVIPDADWLRSSWRTILVFQL